MSRSLVASILALVLLVAFTLAREAGAAPRTGAPQAFVASHPSTNYLVGELKDGSSAEAKELLREFAEYMGQASPEFEAMDCARALAEHMNANYPDVYVRAYNEYFPRSGRVYWHTYSSGVSTWERVEARLLDDPEFRRLLKAARGVFVEDSFDDRWTSNVPL